MSCAICSKNKLNAFLNLGYQPLANKYPKNIKEIQKEQKYKLNLLFCPNCLNVKIDKLIDRKKMFEEYFYLSSINQKLVKHFKKLAKKFKKNDFVIDIGSNDGILLRELKALGIKHLGVDPSVNVAKLANKNGLKTLVGFFDEKITNKIIKDFGKPNIIVASSIFTHLENPTDFVKNTKKLLSKDGTLIIEVEYLAKFIKNIEFERFYFDRPFYYSIKSIDILFKSYGMSLIKVEEIEPHGGSIRCFIKNSEGLKKTQNTKKLLINEKKQLNIKKLNNFKNKVKAEVRNFKNNIINLKKNNQKIIGYGSPARLATITNICKINKTHIDFIIDDSPLKQGRFTPGMHIPIKNYKTLEKYIPDVIIVFAYEYFTDIKKKTKHTKSKYFKPIPFKLLIK